MTLREFFVKLLQDDNLAQYYADREGYIGLQQEGYGLSEDDAELVRSGTLAEIERRILEEHASPGPKPLLIVWPF